MEELLEKVKAFAREAHGEQRRKYAPEPYIAHLVRVMETCREYTQDAVVLSAALLHDVLEDTPYRQQHLLAFLNQHMPPAAAGRTVELVTELTDVYVKAAYPQWNRRKRKARELERLEKTSADSQTIKYADIIDNCREIVRQDPLFARVFLSECNTLLKKLTRGNHTLYQQAVETVQQGLRELKAARAR
jgi:(p)ppGpp synthase/HD superfamily hydrolase